MISFANSVDPDVSSGSALFAVEWLVLWLVWVVTYVLIHGEREHSKFRSMYKSVDGKYRIVTTGFVLFPEISPVCLDALRCRHSNVCVPLENVCDGVHQCPLGDDERFCERSCPAGCFCSDVTITCDVYSFLLHEQPLLPEKLRSLRIASFTNYLPNYNPHFNKSVFETMPFLLYVNLRQIGIVELIPYQFHANRNLRVLDLKSNLISALRSYTFQGLGQLETLDLKGNPIQVIELSSFEGLSRLPDLDLSGSVIDTLLVDSFSGLHSLRRLNISNMGLSTVKSGVFANLSYLTSIDIVGNQILYFDKQMFGGLTSLKTLYSSDFKFCCLRPSTVKEENCFPSKDEFSSCDDLMRNQVLRVFLWVIGFMALLGNLAVLIYRFIIEREGLNKTYGVFVSNLGLADFMMGIYLIILVSADTAFRGKYVWNDYHWRHGVACKIAGVLATLGSEGSVVFLCCITLDRLLVVKYPFGNVKISRNKSLVICLCAWVSLFVLALVPLTSGDYFRGLFYARSAVCLALPLTRDRPAGWEYGIGLFIVFNTISFIWIAVGQVMIYREIYITRGKTASRGRKHDITVARNLLMVAATDFLCWFPIGLMGLFAMSGRVIPGEVYAWIAVFVLPINSALNPFIYTIGSALSKTVSIHVHRGNSLAYAHESALRIHVPLPLQSAQALIYSPHFVLLTFS